MRRDPFLTMTREKKKKGFEYIRRSFSKSAEGHLIVMLFLVILRAGASLTHPSYSLITLLANSFDGTWRSVSKEPKQNRLCG